MSEYHLLDVTFQDEECFIESLKEIGFKPEIHEEAIQLHGYTGDKRQQKAHIVLPRSQVGTSSNDIGFERQGDGKFKAHVSAFDHGRWNLTEKKLKQIYAKNVLVKQAKKSKFKIEQQTTEADGSIKIRMKVKRFQ